MVSVPQSDLQTFTCPNCGATTTFAAGSMTLRCPFCGTEIAVRATAAAAGLHEGALILPFRLDKDASATRIREWLGGGFFAPGDLKSRSAIDRGQGTYVPFWRLDADASSQWEGEVSETKSRRVHRSIRAADGSVREGMVDESYQVWHPRHGTHEGRHRTWVTGSTGLTQSEADALMPFPDEALKTYSSDLLAGFASEEPGIDERGAWTSGEPRIEELEREQCAHQVERLTRVQSELSNKVSTLCFLPVWLYTYQYQNQRFRVLVNGHTGEILGDRPTSRAKVTATIVVVALIVVVIAILFVLAR